MSKGWIRPLAALLAGCMAALLFPPFHASFLVWVCLLPLLASCWTLKGKRSGWKGFGLGWLAGVVSSGIQFSWIGIVSPVGAAVLPLYLGLYWGAFGWFCATWGNPWRKRASPLPDRYGIAEATGPWTEAMGSLRIGFCTAAWWAGLEWLRGWLFTGFGWNGLGVAFHQTPVLAQGADLLGVTGLSMVPVFFQAVLLRTTRRMKRGAEEGKRRTRLDFIAASGVMTLLVCYGILRLASEGHGESIRLKALLVQLNIPQEASRLLWSAEEVHMGYEDETKRALKKLTDDNEALLKKALESSDEGEVQTKWPDWVIWPESALHGRIVITKDGKWGTWHANAETIRRVREEGAFHLIYGINELEGRETGEGELEILPKGRVWNSIAVMDPEDQLQTFRKHHLVIFGETIPFVDSIPWLKRIYEQQSGTEYAGSFAQGESFEPLAVETLGGEKLQMIPSVCFEDTVPRLPRRFSRGEPQVLVNLTNDGWFKESAAAEQHFANARFRAIELRRPMIRCANTGVSAAIDTTGGVAHPDTGAVQILTDAQGSHFTRGSLFVELDVAKQPTISPYSMIGDWGVIVLAVIGLTLAWWTRSRELVASDP